MHQPIKFKLLSATTIYERHIFFKYLLDGFEPNLAKSLVTLTCGIMSINLVLCNKKTNGNHFGDNSSLAPFQFLCNMKPDFKNKRQREKCPNVS